MKMYSKNIRNLDELEREKRRLMKERNQLEQEDIFSVDRIVNSITGSKPEIKLKSDVASVSDMSSLFSLSGPIAGILLEMVKDRITGKIESLRDTSFSDNAVLQKGGTLLKGAAKEVIGGYLKWKAIELTYKGITLVVKRQKRKKAEKLAKESATNL